jgi:hypothetical protein
MTIPMQLSPKNQSPMHSRSFLQKNARWEIGMKRAIDVCHRGVKGPLRRSVPGNERAIGALKGLSRGSVLGNEKAIDMLANAKAERAAWWERADDLF